MTSTTGRRNKRPGGFTLIELVLVMLIVTVVMAMVAPSLRGFVLGRKNTDAAAQIIALAQYARTQAVSTGATYRLNVDATGSSYWLSFQRGVEEFELGTEFGRRFFLPEGTSIQWMSGTTAASDHILFFPDGRTEANPLQLIDAGGEGYIIGCRSETELLTIMQRGAQ